MAKKLGVFGARAEVLDALHGSEDNGHSPKHSQHVDMEPPEQTLSLGSADWTPEQAEQYIDWRLQKLDMEIAGLRAQLEDLTVLRKRWLAVTGGRSKVNGGINGNGSNGSNGGN